MLLRFFYETIREATRIGTERGGDPAHAERYLREIEQAQRFVFTEAATEACAYLGTNIDNLLKAKAQIFAPFPLMWMEFPFERGTIGMMWSGDTDGRQGQVMVIFSEKAHAQPVVVLADVDLDTPTMVSIRPEVAALLTGKTAQAPADAIVTASLRAHMVPTLHWMIAAWALLASKGMTGSVVADLSKLNRQRGQKGLYPLLGYTEIRLNLDAERALRSKSASGTGALPLHPVRAHLRLLPTGKVVIVSAHMRGNPEHGVRGHHYTVLRAEDA